MIETPDAVLGKSPVNYNDRKHKLSSLILESTAPVPDFNPGLEDVCYCGSEQRFWSCCGSSEIIRPPPFGLFMFENYLDKDTVKEFLEYADQSEGQPMMVIENKNSTPDNIIKVQDKRRVTERVLMHEKRNILNELIQNAFVELAQRCVHRSLQWLEAPEVMRYHEGGYYLRHADSQNLDLQTQIWSKVIDRDLSLLIYLNDDFEGGELSFYKLNYQIRPRAGAAVMFPSDHRFLHQAEKVTKGIRYAIVSWASIKGIPKVAKKPPESAIFLTLSP